MSLPLKWEFPGGKIEPGETAQECLHRELMEEMGISVHIGQQLPNSSHCYCDFIITLYPFICNLEGGDIILHEHKTVKWLQPGDLSILDWAEADYPVIAAYQQFRKL